jgi:DnaJ-class molecular chaperone
VRHFWGKKPSEPPKFDVKINYYQELNLSQYADKNTIKNTYHKLCFEYHPDKASGMHENKFKRINEAYEVLGDEKERVKYDEAR